MKRIVYALGMMGFFAACNGNKEAGKSTGDTVASAFDNKDYHTQSNADSVKGTHLFLDIAVDFTTKTISGSALWDIQNPYKKQTIVFDTKDLIIDSVLLDDQSKAAFVLAKEDSVLGSALSVSIKPESKSVKIFYKTTAKATALQWLTPEQTFGKQQPFLYTQSESIHARTWIPVQDGPGVRYTYDAKVSVPKGLMALMSATNPQQKSADGMYTFSMDKPIPAYLMALAVGDISFKAIDERTGVYAEPAILAKAHNEFSEVGTMVHTAEKLYGPYRWGRYDILVLPSGFPIGGMENPKLTFCTPTILAGDKSLVNLIAHELAHNWSGNLVTNQTWNDFWLNEGFTMYFERRITEAMQGKSYTDMLWELGYQDLSATVESLKDQQEDTHLRLNLKGRNPDDGLTDIAYEKGAHLLKLIELTVGRAKMDTFLTKYFNDNAFKTMNTKDFIEYLNKNLLDQNKDWKMKVNINEWVYGAGIPKSCPRADMERFSKVDEVAAKFTAGAKANSLQVSNWSTYEWMHFLRTLVNKNTTTDQMKDLDQAFALTKTQNSEKADLWYLLAIKTKYTPAYPAMQSFLMVTGREKFLQPLYNEMMKTKEGAQMAKELYAKARPNYHPLTQKVVDEIVR
ncbi:aminopeptidase [Taibaiella sp. KBW10]|uniref:M1 family metallopeptidase n=1 Tax=Taibaiella sp. KBW10 TaxID=2153357 RepID=UPI000F59C5A4|nr:M1 family metallopeptidase [Taibaiella sp. KBW10]RQO30114.1 aminopeptidase [Taibaiella sp. KBW10]